MPRSMTGYGAADGVVLGGRLQVEIRTVNHRHFNVQLKVPANLQHLDLELDGGGLQQTLPGGFLNVHTDFLAHTTRKTWSRQVNLLLFLNRNWEESHRGWLELWDAGVTRCVRRIEPLFNRCVVFRTTATSFHGVPAGVACPEGQSRKSIALYYFREEGQTCPLRPTHYVPLPGDSTLRRALIRADQWLVAGYSFVKRHSPLSDAMASKILKRF